MSTDPFTFRRRQGATIATMYAGYAASMVLRMIPTVAGNPITRDASLGIDLEAWGTVLAAGTCGAMTGKFLCGWAADTFGGKRTFTVALFVASLFVGLFAMSSSLRLMQATFFVVLMAQAAGWPSMTKIIVNWASPKQYGRVWGILSTSSRVGTLTATFALGSLLTYLSWRGMLWIAAGIGCVIAAFYGLCLRERPDGPIPDEAGGQMSEVGDQKSDVDTQSQIDTNSHTESKIQNPKSKIPSAHPFDNLTLPEALPRIFSSLRFWLISCSLMGLTILWDFLLVAPIYLRDVLQLDQADASRAASAIPLGSLISVLAGGFVFDKLDRKKMGIVMAGLLAVATGCLLMLAWLPDADLTGRWPLLAALTMLFLFGLCVSPCYYIPCSVFSIDFGGRHSGFLVAILDAIGFAATATFYFFGGGIAQHQGWPAFLTVLTTIAGWSLVMTYFFMQREGRTIRRRQPA
ncbi:MAG: MFS transporter [Planctomycetaceae bacterium]|nr:MFS transporter [Planctomycetaceae bacterium]